MISVEAHHIALQRGVATPVQAPVRDGRAAKTPASATWALTRGSETVLSGSATCAGGRVSTTVSAPSTANLPLGADYLWIWTLTMSGGEVHIARTPAAVCRADLVPSASVDDLYTRVGALNPLADGALVGEGYDLGAKLTEAWRLIVDRLIAFERYPWLILSAGQLREPHILLALALTFDDLSARRAEFATRASDYRQQFTAAWAELALRYDSGDGGQAPGTPAAARPSGVWFGSTRRGRWP